MSDSLFDLPDDRHLDDTPITYGQIKHLANIILILLTHTTALMRTVIESGLTTDDELTRMIAICTSNIDQILAEHTDHEEDDE